MVFKGHIRKALEFALIGRPVRKVLWVNFLFFRYLSTRFEILLLKHPYVKQLNEEPEAHVESNEDSKISLADQGMSRYFDLLRNVVSNLPYQPKISVLIPVYNVDPIYLQECIKSVALQSYQNWEICIVDDASDTLDVLSVVEQSIPSYMNKVKFHQNRENQHISVSSNKALQLATGDYIALLDHDDRILPNALAEVVRFINLNERPDVLYSDESLINEEGVTEHAYHKPGWSPLMHLSVNYTTHFTIYKKALVDSIGGFRVGYEGSQDHDLMLRMTESTKSPIIHIPLVLYQWRSHSQSTAQSMSTKPYAAVAGEKAVKDACQRRGWPADVSFEPQTLHYKVKFKVSGNHLVSIIIPTRNSYELIEPCLRSIFTKTSYKHFEVIVVDHNSDCPKCRKLFQKFSKRFGDRFRLIEYRSYFNFAKMNNVAVDYAAGNLILLLNNDTEVINAEWLEELVSVAQLPDVGAVGPKLLYPNGTIQHAGVIGLGYHVAGHAAINKPEDAEDYFQYFQTTHEVLGVTGACLMVKKNDYLLVNGLEENYVPNGFGDVDICLKLSQLGKRNVYVPYAKLYHKESVSRRASFEHFERQYMLNKWGDKLLQDRYVNPAISKTGDFVVHPWYQVQEISPTYFKSLFDTLS